MIQTPALWHPSYAHGFASPQHMEPANPGLWDGLQGLWVPNLGVTALTPWRNIVAPGLYDAVVSAGFTANQWVMTRHGWAAHFQGDSEAVVALPVPSSGSWSMALYIAGCTYTAWDVLANAETDTENNAGFWTTGNADEIYLRVEVGTVVTTAIYASGLTLTDPHLFVAVFHNVNNGLVEFYVDGKLIGTDATAGDIRGFTDFAMGRGEGSSSRRSNYKQLWGGVWNRVLLPNEIQKLYQDPHAIVRPMQRLWVKAAVVGGTTVDCTLGTIVVASLNPEVEVGTTISATLGAVVIAGLNPEVEAGTTVSATLGAVVVAGLNPEVEAGTTIFATLGALVIAGYNPSVLAGTTITATTGAVVVAGLNPTVSVGGIIPPPIFSSGIYGTTL